MAKQKGFSLIELLIVVAIILVIAAIAIPNLMRARMAANDSSAAGSMHAINVAEVGYFGAYETVGFPATLTPLGGAQPCAPSIATACLIDQSLAGGGPKSGYKFAATGSAGPGSAIPLWSPAMLRASPCRQQVTKPVRKLPAKHRSCQSASRVFYFRNIPRPRRHFTPNRICI